MIIKRDFYLNELISRKQNGLIKVITGLRRVGKSYLLFNLFTEYLQNNGVNDDHIIRINLDMIENESLCDRMVLLQYIKSQIIDTNLYYIFLDEIQMVPRFEGLLNSLLHLENADVYVTGSNSKFLSKDVITEFRGRGDEIHVYPLSFSEFMQVYPGSRETGLQEYLLYGGLPFILSRKTRAEKMQYLKNLFTETYLKDIIARYSIQSQDTLDTILDIISSSIGSLVNTRRIGNTFKTVLNQSVSPTTINKYLDILEDAFLIRKVYRYDVRGRKYVGTPLKYYYEDTGLRNVRLNFRQIESTYLMENAVYMELCRRGFCVDVGMVDHRELDDSGKLLRKQYEIDFVANLGDVRIYIQSAFSIPNLDKYRQESKSLVLTNDSFSKLIVVLDMVPAHQTDDGILIVNLYDFLMDPSILNMARLMQ